MMKAAIYSADAPLGVRLVTVPPPTFSKQHVYDPDGRPSSSKALFLLLLSFFVTISSLVLGFLRLIRCAPDAYGECRGRKMVYCRVVAVGINPVDAKFLYGDKLPKLCLPWIKYFVENRICGIDFSGVVMHAPKGCRFKAGDEVYGTIPPFVGSLAEYVLAPSDFISKKPKNVSFKEAAAIPLVGLTAIQALEEAGIVENMKVLVLGASGGTGHAAVQIAKASKAKVTAVCGSRNKSFVDSLHADEVLCYDECDVVRELEMRSSANGKFDIIFDSVSSDSEMDRKSAYENKLMRGGVLSSTGMYVKLGGVFKDWVYAHLKRYLGLSLFPNRTMLFWVRFPLSSAYLEQLTALIESDKLKVAVSEEFSFTEEGVRKAFSHVMTRRAIGKIVVAISD
jgi:NADPH:quinone reductase-like Zn-dependent oxidoreductase